ncbi:VCBS repeat-containing protein [Sediminibacterium soli]|uniref:VCBS repeat-containing protein n=1 Tax=Sediminibacterium soli TaxID=2698829 RepID=UPI00137AD7F8|nr:VCBS repeat-containing protein [Sediminibacterium soli]NCI47117.1 VCBS repeat-containing protein [Sediminibacterium soli]
MKRILLPLLAVILLLFGCRKPTLFQKIDPDRSGIHFANNIVDNDSLNVLEMENIYNGGGVGIGDFNNDGLQDIYFTGNGVPNKLYLNKGDFKFDDITAEAGVAGKGYWYRGVSVVDINNDGWMDIYVCATLLKDPAKRENLLFINNGPGKTGVPSFSEKAAEYGLKATVHSTMAAFFDYDNDGDLDMYLLVNEIKKTDYPNKFRPILVNSENPNTDKLFRNDWNEALKHPVFTDVSKEAGITIEGYGHGVNICDINKDGWKDIYVTNDFLPNNILYINNGNGTFTDQVRTYFKHTSANSMGQDVVDINNDGLEDVIELDMDPEDNYRKKMMLMPNSYQLYMNMDYYGYQYQYVRNVVQLNQGPRVGQNDSIGAPVFSDIGFLTGIAETDWSWTPLVVDFDNNGFRDIIVTNGFPKDVTDHDFISFRNKAFAVASKKEILDQVPEVKIANYAFSNQGNLQFRNTTKAWGIDEPSFSNGAAYADLDNDGDLDFVVNNINDKAFVYRNTLRDKVKSDHYLDLKFEGGRYNKNGIGAWAEICYDRNKKQVWENTPYRGYLSTNQAGAHFGLGAVTDIDSVVIVWPDHTRQTLRKVKADQVLTVKLADARQGASFEQPLFNTASLFREVSDSVGIRYLHEEQDFIDFNIQKLLPHKLSEYGPAMAAGDIDGNGQDDIIVGGAFGYSAQIFLQQPDGKFRQRPLIPPAQLAAKPGEDAGLLLFDADGDNDLDLYIAGGGYEHAPQSNAYLDRLYLNDGKGNYRRDSLALPFNTTSKFCVRAADYDKDGDLDLFIAGRVEPWNYPKPVSSFIYRNDSRNGKVQFTDVTAQVANELSNIGLVCDMVFTDFDNDGWVDMILAGEWMPLRFFRNEKGVFKNSTEQTGIASQVGWWNTIAPGDFDNDGDIDYIVGNLGKNSLYRASDQYPVAIYAKDFDNNGSYDAFPALYHTVSFQDSTRKLFPAQTREDIVKQVIGMRSRYQNFTSYATATIDQLFSKEQMKDALVLKANNLVSSYLRNDGNGKFTLQPLPVQAQFSVLNGMVVDDFTGDGKPDVLINGNDYGTEVSVGRYDALNGLLLKGDGKGNFTPLSILESGVYIPGNGKSLVKLRGANGKYLLAAAQNRGPMKILALKKTVGSVPVGANDVRATIQYRDGTAQACEFYWGSSFLSQSARFLVTGDNISAVTITDKEGKQRKIR